VIDGFAVVSIRQGHVKMVGFNYVATYGRSHLGRRISRVIGGCEGGLPDTYGMTAAELATILNVCLDGVRSAAQANSGETNNGDRIGAGT
jgi:hypothetical protein